MALSLSDDNTSADVDELGRYVVRQWTSSATHLTAPVMDGQVYEHPGVFGSSPFTALAAPVATVCLKVLNREPVIVMRHGTRVSCVGCKRFSGVNVAPGEDHTTGVPPGGGIRCRTCGVLPLSDGAEPFAAARVHEVERMGRKQ